MLCRMQKENYYKQRVLGLSRHNIISTIITSYFNILHIKVYVINIKSYLKEIQAFKLCIFTLIMTTLI